MKNVNNMVCLVPSDKKIHIQNKITTINDFIPVRPFRSSLTFSRNGWDFIKSYRFCLSICVICATFSFGTKHEDPVSTPLQIRNVRLQNWNIESKKE